jgi:hypothetical protein
MSNPDVARLADLFAPDPQWYAEHVLAYAQPGGVLDVATSLPVASWQAWWRERWTECGTDATGRAARGQGFVLTSAQLAELGWQRHDLRREVRRGRWSVPARGYASPVMPRGGDVYEARRRQHALTAAATARAHHDHVVGGRSAALLHGLPTLHVPRQPERTQREATIGRRARSHVFAASVRPEEISDWCGVPVLNVARTLVDLGRHDRRDAIMAADAALREHLVSVTAIDAALAVATGWPGVRQARDVLALASALAESPLESLARLALHDDGFPEPELQVVIADPERSRSYRVDMVLPRQRLVIELDGLAKYDRAETRREKVRETRLRALGYQVERLLWETSCTTGPRPGYACKPF